MAAQIRRLPSRYSITMTVVLAMIAMYVVNASFSTAAGMPANKVAAAGSDLDVVGPNGSKLVLSEVMKISTTRDLMLHLSAECSILTRLNTQGNTNANATDTDFAFGQVKMSVKIDGKVVPVANDDTATDANGDPDEGEVVFCNRAYQRTVTDAEDEKDGIDAENDYIRTRTANAFTWLALDAGRVYDDPANGNNVIQVDVFAEYDTRATDSAETGPLVSSCGAGSADATAMPAGPTCADAFVGSRTIVVDSDVAANGEVVSPGGNTAYTRAS